MSITTPRIATVPAAEVDRRIQFSDAALAAAGHQVTDPELRRLERRFVSGEISIEEALEAGMRHIDGV